MTELMIDTIYKCSDGEYRKLYRIEQDFLYYHVPISRHPKVMWLDVGRTYREQIEREFLQGTIINENDLILGVFKNDD